MSISQELDLAIKAAEGHAAADGYAANKRIYDTYMPNEEWEAFKASMLPSALEEYANGGGGELVEKNGRPPKMACYGSSSRMIYMLSHGKPGFHYEKKLPTTVGGTANMDGFFEDSGRYVFVEAKCHEPYAAKSNSVSKSYEKLYRFINEQMAGNLEITMNESKCGRYLEVAYFSDGEQLAHMDGNLYCRIRPRRADSKSMKVTFESDGATVRYFDVKQMICHLLGIATGFLQKRLTPKQIDFIYLLYDPTELALAPDKKEIVDQIYERTCYECNLVDLATLLDAKIVRKAGDGLKVLGNGELTRKLTVKAAVFSASAKEKIEAAGGKIEVV